MVVQFRLLGSVEAHHGARVLDIGPPRRRCVLVALLLDANQVVSVDHLVERVWAHRVPQRARETLYSYISRLRRVLTSAGAVALEHRGGGYILTLDPLTVDLHQFHHLLRQARDAADVDAARLLERALSLWRGPAFGTLDTPWVNAARDAAERHRAAAVLDHNDVLLRLGQHRVLLPDLSTQAAARPLDERLGGQLMLTLYRSGQQAEALQTYQKLSARLAEDLGVDPGEELRRLYTAIIRSDPQLTTR
jgi:DNA-binding SARP family transcriptional activator